VTAVAYRPAVLACAACATLAPDQRCPDRCELRFVLSAWSSSYKNARTAGMITSEDWSTIMHGQIAKILARPGSRTVVAYAPEESDFLYGFASGDVSDPARPVVYYAFVKGSYRGNGFARGLLGALGVDPTKAFTYACATPASSAASSKIPLARFDPAVARYTPEERRRSTCPK
jgi:hypothetical protein